MVIGGGYIGGHIHCALAIARRCASPRSLLLGVQLLVSRTQARRILERFALEVVVGVGGYASAPIAPRRSGAGRRR